MYLFTNSRDLILNTQLLSNPFAKLPNCLVKKIATDIIQNIRKSIAISI